MRKKLTKSRIDKVFFGVCGGIADYFGISAFIVRLIFVFASGGLVTLYIILAIFLPDD